MHEFRFINLFLVEELCFVSMLAHSFKVCAHLKKVLVTKTILRSDHCSHYLQKKTNSMLKLCKVTCLLRGIKSHKSFSFSFYVLNIFHECAHKKFILPPPPPKKKSKGLLTNLKCSSKFNSENIKFNSKHLNF